LNWIKLESEEHLKDSVKASFDSENGVLIFKHSTRCSISSVAKSRLESSWDFDSSELPAYYLDLISFRSLSASVADQFNVQHESPQVLLIKNGECTYFESHMGISVKNIHSSIKR
jgi:bacillithiol system protein YtxJ